MVELKWMVYVGVKTWTHAIAPFILKGIFEKIQKNVVVLGFRFFTCLTQKNCSKS
jgi:hypothetical protein